MQTHCDPTEQLDVVYVNQTRGDTFRLTVELADVNGNPVDASGWSWRCQLRDATDVEVAAINIDPTDATIGVLQLTLGADVTSGLALGDYAFDLEATDGEPQTRTLVVGKIRLREDVTR